MYENMKKIIVDLFGGDHAPLEILKGCAMAVSEYGVEILGVGDRAQILRIASEQGISLNGITIEHTPDVIEVTDAPESILKENATSSMAVGLKLLADEQGDAFLSAGSTGALVVGSSLLVKRIKGIKRGALATVIPCEGGCYLLLDAGANIVCRPEMLLQFAVMGSAYMEAVLGIPSPRVGLVNVGTEETKGTDLELEAYPLLKDAPIRFIGNVEPRELPLGGCDVAVCNGFVGNVILKLTEGLGSALMKNIKAILKQSIFSKVSAALTMKKGLLEFKKKMDYTEHGGAPILGIAKPVIKAHGSSNAYAFKNAIRQAIAFIDGDVIKKVETTLKQAKE